LPLFFLSVIPAGNLLSQIGSSVPATTSFQPIGLIVAIILARSMPIQSRSDYFRYLQSDLEVNELSSWRPHYRFRYPVVAWLRLLRRTEFYINCSSTKIGRLYGLALKRRARNRAIQLGFTIPPNVFGPGLSLPHWGTIVVSEKASVGANCRIHPGTCIGEDRGTFPTIGDNAYIGPGAKIYGGVVLGSSVIVGANAVVNKSFIHGHVTLVGIPARPSRPAQQPANLQ
jgi:serine O-acetyltransferase